MPTAAQRSARAALDAARPAVARLDAVRNGEDLAADLIEIWGAIEAGLRTLVGSSALTGQALIREARQRQMINFDQANSLAEFEAVHSRLQNTSYRATDGDVNAARNAYVKLDAALTDTADFGASRPLDTSVPIAATAEPVVVAPAAPAARVARTRPGWLWPVVAIVVVLIAVGGYFAFARGGSSSLNDGITAYKNGQREVAVSDFNKAVRDNAKDPLPHIYLARMAREVGNFSLASNELQLALEADPNSPLALREMGANLLQQGNNELARRFYVRAVTADPSDKMSQGYLGCALMRLGRTQEANNFMTRAGPGPWTSCSTSAATPPPNQVPPGASIPR